MAHSGLFEEARRMSAFGGKADTPLWAGWVGFGGSRSPLTLHTRRNGRIGRPRDPLQVGCCAVVLVWSLWTSGR